MISEIKILLEKELKLEWRKKSTIMSIILFVFGTCFVCYLTFSSFKEIEVWNSTFWIIMLFAHLNVANNSFRAEPEETQMYLSTLANPKSLILAKTIYNALIMSLSALICMLFFNSIFENLVHDYLGFIILIFVSSFAFSGLLTWVNGVSVRASGSSTLMPILSIPLIIPILLLVVTHSNNLLGDSSGIDLSYAKARQGMHVEIEAEISSNPVQVDSVLSTFEFEVNDGRSSEIVTYFGKANSNLVRGNTAFLEGKFQDGKFITTKARFLAQQQDIQFNSLLATALLGILICIGSYFLFPVVAKF